MCTALIKVSFFAIPRHHRRPLFSVACATAIMGNLLGAPITEKKTHTGTTPAAGKGEPHRSSLPAIPAAPPRPVRVAP